MIQNSKHIVFLTPGFPSNENDSTSIPPLQEFLISLRSSLPDAVITVIAFQYPFSSKIYYWNGIQVIPLNGKNSRLRKILIWTTALKHLKKLHQSKKIDVLHSFWLGECTLLGQYFARKHGIRFLSTAMGRDTNFNNLYVRLLSNKNTFVTLSSNHAKSLKANHGLDSLVIAWDLGNKPFPKLTPNTIDVLGVGSITSVKDYSAFLHVIALALNKYRNLKVEIIGGGNESDKIKSLATALNIEKQLIFAGELPRDEVLKKMAKSKILLHTSPFESFGYVFSEALYSGMTIVSFDVGCATSSSKWLIANSAESLLKLLLQAYESDDEKQRTLLFPAGTTLNSYLELYA